MRPLFLIPGLFAAHFSTAQDVADKIAREACPCLDGLDGTTITEEQTAELGVCMIGKAFPYSKDLKRKYGIDLDKMNEETGRELGVLIAGRMASQCPGFAEFAVALANKEEPTPALDAPRNITGTVQETKPGQFLTVVVRKDDGATIELLLLEHVTNAEKVYEDPARARGLKADWSYVEREFFDPFTRSYKTYHVITEVTPVTP
jgi:hypothetical protein